MASEHDRPAEAAHHTFSVSVEREETRGERSVRLFKDLVLFGLAVAFVILIVWLCYGTLVATTANG